MSIFFDEDKSSIPATNESWSKGARTNISENFQAVTKAFGMSEMTQSELNNKTEEYGNIVHILHESGNSNFVNPVDQQFNYQTGENLDNIKTLPELEANFWEQVAPAIKNNKELSSKLFEAGLDSQENMQKTISKKTLDAWKEYSSIDERATTSGKIIGGFGGIMLKSFQDPYMQLGVLASFGYSIPSSFTKAAWKVARYEAIIGGVSETMIQLKTQPYRKELGFEDAGLLRGAKNVGMVMGASAVLSPALMGVFKAFGKGIDVGKKHLFKLSDEELNKVGKEIGDINPKYKKTELDNYNIPIKDNPFPDNAAGRTEHRERLNLTVKSFNENTALDLPPAKNPIDTENLLPPIDFKIGDLVDIFDAKGNLVNAPIVKVSSSGNSVKIKLNDGSEQIISLEPKAAVYQNIRNPNYVIRSSGLDKLKTSQGKTVSELSKEEINIVREKLVERKQKLEEEGLTNQGAYADVLQDLNSIDFNINKLSTETNSPGINKSGFNRNETTLAEDLNNVKDFDVPTEATIRNQTSLVEGSMIDEGTSLAIRSEAGAGSAAKTVPTGKPLAKTQAFLEKSQRTDTASSSTVLATAQTKPPLLTRGETNKVVGDFNSIGKPLYYKTDNINEIYSALSKKNDSIKKELLTIIEKYDGNLEIRIKDKTSLRKKLALDPNMTPQNVSDILGTRISLDTITQAKVLFSELNKKFKLIMKDDFLDDVGRTLTHNTEYRRIHLQALTKDGFSFEIQVSLKELDPLIDINHVLYRKTKYQKDQYTVPEMIKLVQEQKVAEAKIKNKYFKIKDKEFSRLNPTNDIDFPFVVGTRLDENGEKVPLTATHREVLEQDTKALTMLKRLENCI